MYPYESKQSRMRRMMRAAIHEDAPTTQDVRDYREDIGKADDMDTSELDRDLDRHICGEGNEHSREEHEHCDAFTLYYSDGGSGGPTYGEEPAKARARVYVRRAAFAGRHVTVIVRRDRDGAEWRVSPYAILLQEIAGPSRPLLDVIAQSALDRRE